MVVWLYAVLTGSNNVIGMQCIYCRAGKACSVGLIYTCASVQVCS